MSGEAISERCRYCGGAGKFQVVSSASDGAWATCFCSRSAPSSNDEGVRKSEHARIVEKAKQALRATQGCMECNADDERRWMDTIRWLEEQA